MTETLGLFAQTYTLAGVTRKNSITGKPICEPRGPLSVSVLGCGHLPLTEAEIVEHVKEIHGVEPIEVVTRKQVGGEFVEVPHPTVSTKTERKAHAESNRRMRFTAVAGIFSEENRKKLETPHARTAHLPSHPENFLESAKLRRKEGSLLSALHNVSMAEGIATAHVEMTNGEGSREKRILSEAARLRIEIELELLKEKNENE